MGYGQLMVNASSLGLTWVSAFTQHELVDVAGGMLALHAPAPGNFIKHQLQLSTGSLPTVQFKSRTQALVPQIACLAHMWC